MVQKVRKEFHLQDPKFLVCCYLNWTLHGELLKGIVSDSVDYQCVCDKSRDKNLKLKLMGRIIGVKS